MAHVKTYEGKDVRTVTINGYEWYLTVSLIRPRSCKWEASRRDGTKSEFAAGYPVLLDYLLDVE